MKTIKLLTLAFFLVYFTSGNVFAQQYAWAKTIGGTGDDQGQSLVLDANGNVYTIGRFERKVDFDPGQDTFYLSPREGYGIYISKLDPFGNLIWAKDIGGASNAMCKSMSIDATGNLYITGGFSGTVDFDPNIDTVNLTAIGIDIFILKLDANGNFIWAKNIGCKNNSTVNYVNSTSIAINNDGNVFITGDFNDTTDFDPGPNIQYQITKRNRIFILKLDSAGNYIWAKSMGGAPGNYVYSYSIAADNFGNVYTTGEFWRTIDFDPGIDTVNLTHTAGGLYYEGDVFISKLDSNGNYVWAKQMGGTRYDLGLAITTDLYGNVYTTGRFFMKADFDPGIDSAYLYSRGSGGFVSKLDSSGNYIWAKGFLNGENIRCNSITLDKYSNIYTTGSYSGTVDFDPSADTANLTSLAGSDDIFISKLDSSGNYVWARSMGGMNRGVAFFDEGYSIAVDDSDNVYTTGRFSDTADFDPNMGTANFISKGNYDIFISKLKTSTGTSINNSLAPNSTIKVYPNPFRNTIEIAATSKITDIQINDIRGRLVYKESYDIGNNKQTLHLDYLQSGIYFVQIKTETGLSTCKIVRE